ncbi:hypothetical protein P3H15_31250 [Rhodococcus sp. T2V]|uniref:hypothetical protein n=1 Tax=Rhodococcus sp. T2V TaxID=3034164 RepID=UPI0023E34E0B|nr:hypothetical protein [Rhodococcus sp. T2V]MDF3309497.1 hypothetical protein [Rhodococcus sp. T2V]
MRPDQPLNGKEHPMTTTVSAAPPLSQTSAHRRDARSSVCAAQLARLNAAGFPARSALPSRDDGWFQTSRQSGVGGRDGQAWTPARHVVDTAVDTVDVRYHINALMCAGMPTALIAELASVPVATIRSLRSTSTRTTTSAIADAILSITFHPSRGRDLTPAVGARRRLRALNAMGYGDPSLAHRLNVEVDVVTSMPENGLIPSELWEAVDEIYDELSMRPGPDADLREQARAEGLVPPLGWDDDEIDNPKARSHERERATGAVASDEVVIVRRLSGEQVPMRNCERREIIRMAYEQRWSPSLLADKLAIKYDSAVTELSRYRRALVQTDVSGSDDPSTAETPATTDAPAGERGKGETAAVAAAADLTGAHDSDSPREAADMSDAAESQSPAGSRVNAPARASANRVSAIRRRWTGAFTTSAQFHEATIACARSAPEAGVPGSSLPSRRSKLWRPPRRSGSTRAAGAGQNWPHLDERWRLSSGLRLCASRWHRPAEQTSAPRPGRPCSSSLIPADSGDLGRHCCAPQITTLRRRPDPMALIKIPEDFHTAFIAAAHDANDHNDLDLAVDEDRTYIALSNLCPGFFPALRLITRGEHEATVEIWSIVDHQRDDGRWERTEGVDATTVVDLADPTDAARRAVECWLTTL